MKHVLMVGVLVVAGAVAAAAQAPKAKATPLAWHEFEGGLVEIGHDGTGSAFDNERPRHRVTGTQAHA